MAHLPDHDILHFITPNQLKQVDGFKKRIEDLQIQHEKETKDLQERIEKTSKLNVELEGKKMNTLL